MTHPHTPDRGRQAPPTVAEIAALTRRLRDLSARGRVADAGERAALLADKDALLARITDTTVRAEHTDQDPHRHTAHTNRPAAVGGWWARADPDIPTATFDVSGYYSDAQLAAIADARAAGDTARVERLQEAPWTTPAAGAEADAARHEQLTRWHHDDHPDGDDIRVTDVGVVAEHASTDHPDDAGAGWDR